MIWIILFVIIVIASAILAWVSMKGYQEFPPQNFEHSLFLINNPELLSEETIKKIYNYSLNNELIFSIEKLYKGEDKAIILFGPTAIIRALDDLKLTELEDYLLPKTRTLKNPGDYKAVSVNNTITWTLNPEKSSKGKLILKDDFTRIEGISADERVFIQFVLSPHKNTELGFQTTIRVMVVSEDPNKRIELAKNADEQMKSSSNLIKKESGNSVSSPFDSYKLRSLIPKELSPLTITSGELLRIIKS